MHDRAFFALPVQAICDAKYRFLYMSARCVRSTHDSLACACSSLGLRLSDGVNLGTYWLAGDAAYICTNYLLTPFTKSYIMDPHLGQRRNSFNFFQSSLRIHAEQSFGIVIARFGILWRPLKFQLPTVPHILSACMRILNWRIDTQVGSTSDA
jgi:DDE superfamily endonuclease